MSLKKRVYLTGASGVGKTRLAKYISSKYGLVLLPSASRTVLREFGAADYQEVMDDPMKLDNFQRNVFHRQLKNEADQEGSFVSDRAFDNVVYTAHYGRSAWQLYRSPEYRQYIEALRISDDSVVIFHVQPTRACLNAALEGQPDRKMFLDWDAMMRTDGAIKFILEANEIRHIPVSTDNFLDRQRTVDFVMSLLPKK